MSTVYFGCQLTLCQISSSSFGKSSFSLWSWFSISGYPAGVTSQPPLRLLCPITAFRLPCGSDFSEAVTSIREQVLPSVARLGPHRIGRSVYSGWIPNSGPSAGVTFRKPLRLFANKFFHRLHGWAPIAKAIQSIGTESFILVHLWEWPYGSR